MEPAATHHFEEHTGEVLLELEAASLEALFAESGRALAELQAVRPPKPDGREERISLRAHDRAALLVDWIDELIFRSERSKRVFTEFALDQLTDHELHARVQGGEPVAIRTAVKAATFHKLVLEQTEDGWHAAVILDV